LKFHCYSTGIQISAIFNGYVLAPVRFNIRTIQRLSRFWCREIVLPRDGGGGGYAQQARSLETPGNAATMAGPI
jgi:hypothetical protein